MRVWMMVVVLGACGGGGLDPEPFVTAELAGDYVVTYGCGDGCGPSTYVQLSVMATDLRMASYTTDGEGSTKLIPMEEAGLLEMASQFGGKKYVLPATLVHLGDGVIAGDVTIVVPDEALRTDTRMTMRRE